MDLVMTVLAETQQATGILLEDMVPIHETALQLLEADYNVLPYGLDVIVPNLDYRRAFPFDLGGKRKLCFEETPIRIWRARGPLKKVYKEAEPLKAYPVRCPSPETILRLLPSSPDFPYLREQYAGLAEILYFDRMTDEELGEFFRYVRI